MEAAEATSTTGYIPIVHSSMRNSSQRLAASSNNSQQQQNKCSDIEERIELIKNIRNEAKSNKSSASTLPSSSSSSLSQPLIYQVILEKSSSLSTSYQSSSIYSPVKRSGPSYASSINQHIQSSSSLPMEHDNSLLQQQQYDGMYHSPVLSNHQLSPLPSSTIIGLTIGSTGTLSPKTLPKRIESQQGKKNISSPSSTSTSRSPLVNELSEFMKTSQSLRQINEDMVNFAKGINNRNQGYYKRHYQSSSSSPSNSPPLQREYSSLPSSLNSNVLGNDKKMRYQRYDSSRSSTNDSKEIRSLNGYPSPSSMSDNNSQPRSEDGVKNGIHQKLSNTESTDDNYINNSTGNELPSPPADVMPSVISPAISLLSLNSSLQQKSSVEQLLDDTNVANKKSNKIDIIPNSQKEELFQLDQDLVTLMTVRVSNNEENEEEQSHDDEVNERDSSKEQGREEKYRALVMQARTIQESISNGIEPDSLVPFGYSLQDFPISKEGMGENGQADANNQSGKESLRPPPIIPKRLIHEIKVPVTVTHKEGYLSKSPTGKKWYGIGQWKTRWFKLSGRLLIYSSNKESLSPKGMFDLATVDVETNPEKIGSTPTPYAFMISTSSNKIKMSVKICATTYRDILEWYAAIIGNILLLCKTNESESNVKYSPPPEREWKKTNLSKFEQDIEDQLARIPQPPYPEESKFYPIFKRPATYYELLGVETDATPTDIKKKFYKLARDLHPDRNPDIDPAKFAAISKAYDTLQDATLRTEYDLCERVKEMLRHGFSCTQFIPIFAREQLARPQSQRYPYKVKIQKVIIFCDGMLDCIYYQPISNEQSDQIVPLEPKKERCSEVRYISKAVYGLDDVLFRSYCREKNSAPITYENERVVVISGEKMNAGNLYLEFDNPKLCKEFIDGFRAIRCETSAPFKRKLDEMIAKGMR